MILERLTLPMPANRQWRSAGKRVYLCREAAGKRQVIATEIYAQLGGRPTEITTPVDVSIIWKPRYPKRHCDVDAYAKGCLDALTAAGVWTDDALVESLSIRRLRGHESPGWWSVTISPAIMAE